MDFDDIDDDDTITTVIKCPITCDIMNDPVIDPDGNTYERSAILSWLDNNHTSPITRKSLRKDQLVPNHSLLRFLTLCQKEHWEQQLNDDDESDDSSIYFDNVNDDFKEVYTEEFLNRLLLFAADGFLTDSNCSNDLILSCPITGEIIKEPVTDLDGYTFEKSAISTRASYNDKSPFSKTRLRTRQLIPNRAVALLVRRYHQLKKSETKQKERDKKEEDDDTHIIQQQHPKNLEHEESILVDSSMNMDDWTTSEPWVSFPSETSNRPFPDSLVKLEARYNKKNALVQIQVSDDTNNHRHVPTTIVVVAVIDDIGAVDEKNSSVQSSSLADPSSLDLIKDSILTIIQILDANDQLAIIVSSSNNSDSRNSSNGDSISSRRSSRAKVPQVVLPITKMTNHGKETAAEALFLLNSEVPQRIGIRKTDNTRQISCGRNRNSRLSSGLLKAMDMLRTSGENTTNSNMLLFTNNNDSHGRSNCKRKIRGVRRIFSNYDDKYHLVGSPDAAATAGNIDSGVASDICGTAAGSNGEIIRIPNRYKKESCTADGHNDNEVLRMVMQYKKKYSDSRCRISIFGLSDGTSGCVPATMAALISIANFSHGYYYFLPDKNNNNAILRSAVKNVMTNILSTAIQETTLEIESSSSDDSIIHLKECISETITTNSNNNNTNNENNNTTTMAMANAAGTIDPILSPLLPTSNRNRNKLCIPIPPLLYGQTFDVLLRIQQDNNCSPQSKSKQSCPTKAKIPPFCVSLNKREGGDPIFLSENCLAIETALPIYKNSNESNAMKLANVRFKLIHFLHCVEKCFDHYNTGTINVNSNNNCQLSTTLLQQKINRMLHVLKKYAASAQSKNTEFTNNSNNTSIRLKAIREDIEGPITAIFSDILRYKTWGAMYALSYMRAHILQQPQQCFLSDSNYSINEIHIDIFKDAEYDTNGTSNGRATATATATTDDNGDYEHRRRGNDSKNSIQTLYATKKFEHIQKKLCC